MANPPPLFSAARYGRVEEVRRLLQQGANIEVTNELGWTPLHAATYYDRKETVRVLLQHQASLEARIEIGGRQPLHKAAERGNVEIMQLLQAHGANIEGTTTNGTTPLFIAAWNGRITAVSHLVQQGADIEARSKIGMTPLYAAAREGYEQVVQYLIEKGANSRADTDEGWTPLHAAAYYGHRAVVKLLVRDQENLERELRESGRTPLHKAAEKSDAEIVRILIEAGAELNSRMIDGQTPLYVAAQTGNLEVVQVLLKRDAKINLATLKVGWTPLHVAVSSGNKAITSVLLDNGADRNIEDSQGRTALSLAKDGKDRELVSLFTSNYFGGTMPTKDSGSSDAWFGHLSQLSKILLRRDGNSKVKIAVIDSGIEENHPQMRHVKNYKDFVTQGEKMVDNTKHGSTGVHLICRVLEQGCDIYVARVFESNAGSKEVQDRIAQAIEHARTEWQVDIITLASGFDRPHQGMANEIRKASENVLIFAAASNTGNIGRITFPANLVGQVMCMFATNSKAKGITVGINPAPNPKSINNFAILGENVVPYPSAKPQSGTSMATFIGAAVAGLILDFSRHDDVEKIIKSRQHLKTFDGMSAVFKKMATKELYDCVAPWEIRGHENMSLEDERGLIAYKIADAVDSR